MLAAEMVLVVMGSNDKGCIQSPPCCPAFCLYSCAMLQHPWPINSWFTSQYALVRAQVDDSLQSCIGLQNVEVVMHHLFNCLMLHAATCSGQQCSVIYPLKYPSSKERHRGARPCWLTRPNSLAPQELHWRFHQQRRLVCGCVRPLVYWSLNARCQLPEWILAATAGDDNVQSG
jgi:hypothetical protein